MAVTPDPLKWGHWWASFAAWNQLRYQLGKRKVRANPPTGKKLSCSQSLWPEVHNSSSAYKGTSQWAVSNGKLFCGACREELSLKATVVKNHLKSDKHKERKRKLEGKDAQERDIVTALQKHNQTSHLEGETLPIEQQVYRVSVLTTFLKAGVPPISCLVSGIFWRGMVLDSLTEATWLIWSPLFWMSKVDLSRR